MASNVQAGTRGLSAGDWIRLKRLQGARNFQSDKDGDVTNPSPLLLETTQGARRVFTEFGTSKIRRPASFWTDYRASQTADYVLERQDSETKSRSLDINNMCGCTNHTYNVVSYDTDVIYISLPNDIRVGDVVYFTNIAVEGSYFKNNVNFYVVDASPLNSSYNTISVSDTPGGSIIDPISDGSDLDQLTNITTVRSIPSAIKHNPTCIKCIHS